MQSVVLYYANSSKLTQPPTKINNIRKKVGWKKVVLKKDFDMGHVAF